jgi:mRNA interferase RelE/StbE
MPYQILWTRKARSKMEKLDSLTVRRIVEKLEEVRENPFSFVIKLRGLDLYRLRVGDYRVIMKIESGRIIIFIIDIGHRSSVYRKY